MESLPLGGATPPPTVAYWRKLLVQADLVQRVDGREPIISLRGADLSDAYLSEADLTGADLSRADLFDADLMAADLGSVEGVTEEQLTAAESLKGATMPDGQKYEDWLKDKESHGEDE